MTTDPELPADAIAPAPRLFSASAILVATLLGSPLGGCALLAINYRRLGQPREARLAWLWGAVSTVALVALSMVLPEKFPSQVLPAAYTVTMYQFAAKHQGKAYDTHLARGGAKASMWAAVGIGLACLLVVFLLAIGVISLLPEQWLPELRE